MRKLLYAISLTAALACATAAQTVVVDAPPARTQAASRVEDCGCEGKPLPEVLAAAGGVKITKQDISTDTQRRIEELRKQVTEERRSRLDLQINSILFRTLRR
jgi:hypothetical protein